MLVKFLGYKLTTTNKRSDRRNNWMRLLMKKLIFLLSGMCLFMCCENRQRLTSIEVYSILHTISTPRNMHAIDVINWREKEFWSSRSITSADSVSIVMQMIEDLKGDSNCTDTDARAVLLLHFESHTDTLEGDYACLLYQGKTYRASREMNKLFWGKLFEAP
jgi:hypothetical protein